MKNQLDHRYFRNLRLAAFICLNIPILLNIACGGCDPITDVPGSSSDANYLRNLTDYVKEHNASLMPDTRSYHLRNLRAWWDEQAKELNEKDLSPDDRRKLEQVALSTVIKMYDAPNQNFGIALLAKGSEKPVAFGDAKVSHGKLLYRTDIKISENHIAHVNDQFHQVITGLVPGEYTVFVRVSDRSYVPEQMKAEYFNLFPLFLHEGTRKYANQLVLKDQRTPKYKEMFGKLDGYFRDFSHFEKSQFMFFGSMTLGTYNLFVGTKYEQRRPRDIDGWYLERNKELHDKLKKSKAKLDIYGVEATWVTDKGKDGIHMSMIDRYFSYYQSMANAEVGIKYVVHPHKGEIGSGAFKGTFPKQKFQSIDYKEANIPTVYDLYDLSDLFSDDRNSFFYNGFRFLSFELEVFRKHLRFLDNCEMKDIPTFSCDTRLETKDKHDFDWIANLVKKGNIVPPPQFGTGDEAITRYLGYLAIDGNLDIPIHQIQILASVPMDKNVPLKQNNDANALPVVIRTPIGLNEDLAKTIKKMKIPVNRAVDVMDRKKSLMGQSDFVRISEKQILGDVPGENSQVAFNKTNNKIGGRDMASATFRSDLRSAYDFMNQKLFRDPLISSLPQSPIKSVFGDLPSGWTYVLQSDGKFNVLLTTSGFELGSKHLFLMDPGAHAVAAGEMLVLSDGTIVFNLLSGTFMKKLFKKDKQKYEEVKLLMEYILIRHSLADPEQQYPLVVISDNLLIPYRARPHFGEVALMCTQHRFENRLFSKIDKVFDRYYVNIEDFFAGVKRPADNTNLCDILLNQPNDATWTKPMRDEAITPDAYLRFEASYVPAGHNVNDAAWRKNKLEQRLNELKPLVKIE